MTRRRKGDEAMSFEDAWNVVKGMPIGDAIDNAGEEGAKAFVEEVRDLVEQGMDVMSAVRNVARLLGLDGRDLMRAYTEAYR